MAADAVKAAVLVFLVAILQASVFNDVVNPRFSIAEDFR